VADKQKSSRTTTARTRVVTAEGDTSNKKQPKATKAVAKPKATTTKPEATKKPTAKKRYNVFVAFWGYLKGAWYELRQVRWPTRKETWGMTFAVILFTAFFVILVLLLDAGYKYLFDIILKR
jgi:preprotein translocase SecE subunit